MDYRDFQGPGSSSRSETLDRRWWTLSAKEASKSISSVLSILETNHERRVNQHVVSSRLYGNIAIMGLMGVSYAKLGATQNAARDRITFNVVQAVIDTVVAKLCKNQPKPLFLTSGGDYRLQRKAKKMNKFIDGIFNENQAYHLGAKALRDACVFGDGIIHVYIKKTKNGQRIALETVLPSELRIDEMEAFYGEPRQLHWIKQVDRAVAEQHFPDSRSKIKDANPTKPDDIGYVPNVADMVTVRESWHLPSSCDAKDGKRIITLDGEPLTPMENYTKDFFPFARMPWCPRLWGFWSQGLSEQLQSIQLEINKLLWVIQRSHHLSGSFKILLEKGSKVVKEHLNNDIGAIINYTGIKPEYVVPPIVQPEIYEQLKWYVAEAYQQAGISELSAGSQKPAGLNSGESLREYNNIESDRFMTIGKAYEKFFIDLGKLSLSIIRDIVEEDGDYEVKARDRNKLLTMKWKDIEMDEEDYSIQCFPVSSLPNDPEGRLATVQEYAQAGYFDTETAKRLLQFPDLEQIETLDNAQQDYLTEILDKIIEDAVYTAPEPFDNLALGRKLALQYYEQGKCSDLEEEKLELLRRFIQQIDTLTTAAQSPAPLPSTAQPQASPAPPPVSNLVPNVPGPAAA